MQAVALTSAKLVIPKCINRLKSNIKFGSIFEDPRQCGQIGRTKKILGRKFSYKSSQNIFDV